jgi:hypothetical protein
MLTLLLLLVLTLVLRTINSFLVNVRLDIRAGKGEYPYKAQVSGKY